jgi:ubiquitin carboxyl-terminal hydrolase 34
MINDEEEIGVGISVESESDVLSTVPAVDTPSSSPSAVGSPQIELVISEDDQDFGKGSPPVAIIGEDEIFPDPMQTFPYAQEGESLVTAAKRLATWIQYGTCVHVKTLCPLLNSVEPIEDEKCFVDIRDWIESYLQYTSSHRDGWYESYSNHRDFWFVLPEVIWALSWRRFVAEPPTFYFIC